MFNLSFGVSRFEGHGSFGGQAHYWTVRMLGNSWVNVLPVTVTSLETAKSISDFSVNYWSLPFSWPFLPRQTKNLLLH